MSKTTDHSASSHSNGAALVVWQILDGKPGHENQSAGLIDALKAIRELEVIQVRVEDEGITWLQYLLGTRRFSQSRPQPDWIIGAGSRTHPTILGAGSRFKAKTIVLMAPSALIRARFDLCIIPEHDQISADNVLSTRGALNTIRPSLHSSSDQGLFLIGGPSKHHSWDEARLVEQVETILQQNPHIHWKLTTSRRTPKTTLAALNAVQQPKLSVYPCDQTPKDWVAEALGQCGTVWASEDSVSMVYEALSSGASVGLLGVPRMSKDSRVLRGLDKLIAEGHVQSFTESNTHLTKHSNPSAFNEAERVAKIIEAKFLNKP